MNSDPQSEPYCLLEQSWHGSARAWGGWGRRRLGGGWVGGQAPGFPGQYYPHYFYPKSHFPMVSKVLHIQQPNQKVEHGVCVCVCFHVFRFHAQLTFGPKWNEHNPCHVIVNPSCTEFWCTCGSCALFFVKLEAQTTYVHDLTCIYVQVFNMFGLFGLWLTVSDFF